MLLLWRFEVPRPEHTQSTCPFIWDLSVGTLDRHEQRRTIPAHCTPGAMMLSTDTAATSYSTKTGALWTTRLTPIPHHGYGHTNAFFVCHPRCPERESRLRKIVTCLVPTTGGMFGHIHVKRDFSTASICQGSNCFCYCTFILAYFLFFSFFGEDAPAPLPEKGVDIQRAHSSNSTLP